MRDDQRWGLGWWRCWQSVCYDPWMLSYLLLVFARNPNQGMMSCDGYVCLFHPVFNGFLPVEDSVISRNLR